MECPKCGAAQASDCEECVSCGVLFTRWREAHERTALAASHRSESPPVVEDAPTSPVVVVAIVIAVLIAGTGWTVSRRSQRAENKAQLRADLNTKMEEINRKMGEAERRRAAARLAAERARSPRPTRESPWSAAQKEGKRTWPPELQESSARAQIETCTAFTEAFAVSVSKRDRYSSSEAADLIFGLGILTRDPSTGWVSLPHATDRALILDQGDRFVVDFGTPRVEKILSVDWNEKTMNVKYRWKFDNANAQRLARPRRGEPEGQASFRNDGGVWVVERATAPYLNRNDATCP